MAGFEIYPTRMDIIWKTTVIVEGVEKLDLLKKEKGAGGHMSLPEIRGISPSREGHPHQGDGCPRCQHIALASPCACGLVWLCTGCRDSI